MSASTDRPVVPLEQTVSLLSEIDTPADSGEHHGRLCASSNPRRTSTIRGVDAVSNVPRVRVGGKGGHEMSDLAVLFPGQGSQEPGMRERVARARPDLLDAVGEECFARVDEGTQWAQPAIFAASLAAWAEREEREEPGWAAGHSLGEITALVVAGAVSEPSALDLVVERGRLMGQAREGGMVAVMGAGAAELAPELAAAHGLAVANDNSPQQVVLSGPRSALPGAAAAAKAAGLRPMDLPVAGAFHSPLMAPAVAPFRAALDRVSFSAPGFPVVSGVTAAPIEDPRRALADGIVSPVRWREVLLALHAAGANRFAEVGPGRVLSGLVKRTLPREVVRV